MTKWQEDNKEKYKEYQRLYYLKNKEKYPKHSKEYYRKWREKNREKVREYHKKYYLENKEKYQQNQKKNRDKINARKQAYRLSKIGKEKEKTRTKTRHLIEGGKIKKLKYCQKCNSTKNIEIHHKDYTNAYNIIFLCRNCHRGEHLI